MCGDGALPRPRGAKPRHHTGDSFPLYRLQQIAHRGIVPECLTDVYVQVHIPRPKDETPAQLKWIPAQSMLPLSRRPRPLARNGILRAQQMQQGRGL